MNPSQLSSWFIRGINSRVNVELISTSCCIQLPESKRKGHVDRLRVEEKWQSRARLTETSFGFLEAQKNEASSEVPLLPLKKSAEAVEDWHFEKPHVCINYIYIYFQCL